MNVIQEFATQWPQLWTLVETLCVLIPLAAFLAYSGINFVSALARILSRVRKRASFDKCARQLASLGFILGWFLLVGTRIWLFLTRAEAGRASYSWMMEAGWFLLAASVLMTSLYYALWNPLTKHPALSALLGLFSGLASCAALFTTLMITRFYVLNLLPPLPETAAGMLKLFVIAENNLPLWNILWYTPALIMAFSAGVGALWLFARRRRDDFGRDHYNAMLAWCARLSRNAWILLWAFLLVFSLFQLPVSAGNADDIWPEIAAEMAYLLYWAIPALLWTFVSRSAVPLRHGLTLFTALLLAGTFLAPYYLELCAE
ncbi:MAG: hypothetical protein LBC94_06755 [Desulfovibrio sp.]|nr:hypothetical protein [Desulfovibrio sp.]